MGAPTDYGDRWHQLLQLINTYAMQVHDAAEHQAASRADIAHAAALETLGQIRALVLEPLKESAAPSTFGERHVREWANYWRRRALAAEEAWADALRDGIKDAAARLQAAEEWQVVPKEPTQAMCRAAVIYANGNAVYRNVAAEALKIEESIYSEVYAAMLAAAPRPATHPAQAAEPVAPIEDPVTVPRGLLGAACAAIERKHDAPKTLAHLRRYTVGDLSVAPQPAANAEQPTEAMARFCPGCGSVGEVPAQYRDCCPDGSDARMIPAKLAQQCRDLFRAAPDSVATTPATLPSPVGASDGQTFVDVSGFRYVRPGVAGPDGLVLLGSNDLVHWVRLGSHQMPIHKPQKGPR